MDELDFTMEFNSPLDQETEGALFALAEEQLRQLSEGHDDMRGAAVNIRTPAKGNAGYLYEVTVVVYSRPEHVAATEKNEDYNIALRGALDGVARQIRDRREKLSKRWEEPDKGRVPQEVMEVVMAEETEEEESE